MSLQCGGGPVSCCGTIPPFQCGGDFPLRPYAPEQPGALADAAGLSCHILHKSKEPRFSPTLWVQDLIQFNNEIASFVAASFLNRTLPLSTRSLKRQVVQLATARRLAGRAAYKDCCNYFFSVAYFGNGVYGLAEASLLYFDKEYTALEQREFIILCLTLRNPILYNPLEERRQPRIQQVADTIQQEFESSSAE
ncbi:MAG: transglycosylase domain-containing protein [Treponema sp.]|nr:transglycosylase domain-containing protein [Treponema sp.]